MVPTSRKHKIYTCICTSISAYIQYEILQGEKAQDGSFVAQTLTIRCPSKYITEAEKAELDLEKNQVPKIPPYGSYEDT